MLLIFVSSGVAKSQSVGFSMSTITWTSDKSIDQLSSTERKSDCVFKTYGLQKIEITQGTSTRTLNVVGSEGSWQDVNSIGGITLKVTYGSLNGVLKIERTPQEVFVLLDFSATSDTGQKRKYIVSSVSIN